MIRAGHKIATATAGSPVWPCLRCNPSHTEVAALPGSCSSRKSHHALQHRPQIAPDQLSSWILEFRDVCRRPCMLPVSAHAQRSMTAIDRMIDPMLSQQEHSRSRAHRVAFAKAYPQESRLCTAAMAAAMQISGVASSASNSRVVACRAQRSQDAPCPQRRQAALFASQSLLQKGSESQQASNEC